MKSRLFSIAILFSLVIAATSVFTCPSSAYELIAAWTMDEDIQAIMNNGLQVAILAVSPSDSLTTTWGRVKGF